ncbi:putative imidazolonepropionase [Sorochytrium milnesiophthora]
MTASPPKCLLPQSLPPVKSHFRSLFRNAAQVVLVCSNGEPFKTGKAMDEVAIMSNASVLVDNEGKIVAVGTEQELMQHEWYRSAYIEFIFDCTGKSILPGFVDGHTHPVWAGDRVHEFAMKLSGATYMDIHKAGGGIGYTVKHTREANEDELLASLQTRVDRMLKFGTTFVEAKSGYGLDVQTELKMLRVMTRHNNSFHPVQLSITFLGAHSVPKDHTLASYTAEILDQQIPAILAECEQHRVHVDNIDVFYEKGVFERDETLKVLQRGKELGWTINFHGDELHPMQSGEVGALVSARAISHLEEVSEKDIALMAQHTIFAVLLPTTAYVLRIKPPPARAMIDAGVPVALGSDFNPNAHCVSLPHVMNLACINMRMTMNEALVACTINSAASLHAETLHGSIEPGKWANLVVVNNPDWRHVVYEVADPPIEAVYVKGHKAF